MAGLAKTAFLEKLLKFLIDMDDFAEYFQPSKPTLLSGNVRFYFKNIKNNIVEVSEFAPSIKTITYVLEDGEDYKFQLLLPYIVILKESFELLSKTQNINSFYIYFNKQPLNNIDELYDLRPAFLPNVYSDGEICLGSLEDVAIISNENRKSNANITPLILNAFFNSEFNSEVQTEDEGGFDFLYTWNDLTLQYIKSNGCDKIRIFNKLYGILSKQSDIFCKGRVSYIKSILQGLTATFIKKKFADHIFGTYTEQFQKEFIQNDMEQIIITGNNDVKKD
jgi:hypothetical protein